MRRLVGEVLGLALELLPLDKAALQSKAARRQQAAGDARQGAAAAAERRAQGQQAKPWSVHAFLRQPFGCSGAPLLLLASQCCVPLLLLWPSLRAWLGPSNQHRLS